MKRTVINMLKQAAETYKSSDFVVDKLSGEWKARTFSDVNNESNYFASSLINLGFKKNDKISIIAEGRGNWVTSEFGLLKAGCISVPLSVKLQPEEILFRIQHSDSKGLIITKNNYEKVASILEKLSNPDFKIIYLDDDKETFDKLNLIPENANVFYYHTLIETGYEGYELNFAKLNEIEENTEEDDLVTISYTSGTTGNPKGIMLTHLNYWANSYDALNYFNLTEYLKTLIILPLDHSFAHTVGTYIALLNGISISFVDAKGGGVNTLKNIPINLKEVKPDFLLTVPALTGNFMKKIKDGINAKGGFVKWLFNKGLKAGLKINKNGYKKADIFTQLFYFIPYKLADILIFKKVRQIFGGNLQFCVGGGALLDIKQQQFFYTIGAPIYQGYGLTEATPIISANCEHTHKLGSSGKILPGIQCKIIKSDGSEAKIGEKGEIVIKGLNVMKGYYKNPEATNETIKDGWLYTGDMGYMDEDDFLIVVGREKALLISEDGEKYSPEGIEEAIMNSSSIINQVMLYNDHKKITSALITLDVQKLKKYIEDNDLKEPKEILEHIRISMHAFKNEKVYKDKFPEKWIPVAFRIITEPFSEQNGMINSTMKMVRFKITEVYKNKIDELYSSDCKIACKENMEDLKKILEDE